MKLYGLIGYPLGHSFSKSYFEEKFKRENIDAKYQNFEISSIEAFPGILKNNPNLFGISVTSPYKKQVIPYLDELSEEAERLQAVNCIKVIRENDDIKTTGYNTDIYGFTESLRPFISCSVLSALILGTGGAARAVGESLRQLGLPFNHVSRTPRENMLTYSDLDEEKLTGTKLIVNATPLGMHPNENLKPDIEYEYIGASHVLFDLIYNPSETLFLKAGRRQRATTVNGLRMLQLQAEKAWKIFSEDN